MLKFGKITGIKAEAGLFQVTFDEDQLVSGWLFGAVPNTKENKDERPFDQDEHVACLLDENCEQGIVLCSIYDKKNAPPVGNKDIRVTTYKDGSFIQYDRANNKFTISCEGDLEVIKSTNATVTASQTVSVSAQDIEFNGGNNYGVVKVIPLLTKLNNLESKINALISLINTWAPVAGDGGAALKAALTTWLVAQLTLTAQADIENPDFTH